MTESKGRWRDDNCKKIYAVYRCTNDDCKKSWQSYHGWKSIETSYQEQCGRCDTPGRVTQVVQEEMTSLDIYVCFNCDRRWELIHPSSGTSSCPDCQIQTELSGVQERVTSKVTFVCGNNDCKETWTSPWFNKEFSQKCLKCFNQGKFINTITVEDSDEESCDEKRSSGRGRRGGRFGRGGAHPPEGCDMCEVLKPLGENCLEKDRLDIRESHLKDGRVVNSVTFARNGPAPHQPYTGRYGYRGRGGFRGRGGYRGRGGRRSQNNRSEVVESTSTLPAPRHEQEPGPHNARNRRWREAQKAKKLALQFGALDLQTGEKRGDQSKA